MCKRVVHIDYAGTEAESGHAHRFHVYVQIEGNRRIFPTFHVRVHPRLFAFALDFTSLTFQCTARMCDPADRR